MATTPSTVDMRYIPAQPQPKRFQATLKAAYSCDFLFVFDNTSVRHAIPKGAVQENGGKIYAHVSRRRTPPHARRITDNDSSRPKKMQSIKT
jgi:hypothetical protein